MTAPTLPARWSEPHARTHTPSSRVRAPARKAVLARLLSRERSSSGDLHAFRRRRRRHRRILTRSGGASTSVSRSDTQPSRSCPIISERSPKRPPVRTRSCTRACPLPLSSVSFLLAASRDAVVRCRLLKRATRSVTTPTRAAVRVAATTCQSSPCFPYLSRRWALVSATHDEAAPPRVCGRGAGGVCGSPLAART
jgi:hypothetical protein